MEYSKDIIKEQNKELVLRIIQQNPRQVKRFLNSLVVAVTANKLEIQTYLVMEMLNKKWPKFQQELDSDKEFRQLAIDYLHMERNSRSARLSVEKNNQNQFAQVKKLLEIGDDLWAFLDSYPEVIPKIIQDWDIYHGAQQSVKEIPIPTGQSQYVAKSRMDEFLDIIGLRGLFTYSKIDEVFVPPLEYEEIRKTLDEERCVFITGPAGYGKTFTAIDLLWELYKSFNYAPRYIGEEIETAYIITKLVNQDESLKNNIIYIEDPVGKIEYRYNKEFEESIASIISGLRHPNIRLVVTMREEIYQQFNPIGKQDLKKYIIANHSYDSERRKEMLYRWATIMNCKWFQDESLRKAVLEYMKNDETKLPTPLNIKDFASQTSFNGASITKTNC